MTACSIKTSATWIVYIGPDLDLQGTVCYLNPYRLPPAQLILSGPGYLSPWHSTDFSAPIRSSMRKYNSLILDRRCLQRLKIPVFFPIPLPMPTSWNRDANSLASLPSVFMLHVVIPQHQNRQVTRGSPDGWLKCFLHILQLTWGYGSGDSLWPCFFVLL